MENINFNIASLIIDIFSIIIAIISFMFSLYNLYKQKNKKPKIKLIDMDYHGNNTISNKYLKKFDPLSLSDKVSSPKLQITSDIELDMTDFSKELCKNRIKKLKESKLEIKLDLSIKNLNSIDLNIQDINVTLIDINNNDIKKIDEQKIKIENNCTINKRFIFKDIEEITFDDVKNIIITFKYNNKSFYKKLKVEKFRSI